MDKILGTPSNIKFPPGKQYTICTADYSMHGVPECLSLRRNLVPPSPPSQASVPPSLDPKGGGSNTRLRVKGVGGPSSDEWTESLALCILCGISCEFSYQNFQ
jgi:hypothetical protein